MNNRKQTKEIMLNIQDDKIAFMLSLQKGKNLAHVRPARGHQMASFGHEYNRDTSCTYH